MKQSQPTSHRVQLDKTVKQYILDAIDNSGYENNTPFISGEDGKRQRLIFLISTFRDECGWMIARYGEQKAFREWLQGLPSAIDTAWENYKIIELAKQWGSIDPSLTGNALERREDLIINNWFNFITVKTFQLFKKYKIN